MKKNPYVSVIMPVYKVEQYLNTAIKCILEQSFYDIELILVDDCSPDHSGEICDRYSMIDSRVKVIHKDKNEGLSEARNTGMQLALGEWIMFIDSDDWVDKEVIESALNFITETTDIVVWGYQQEFENRKGEKIDTRIALPEKKKYFGLQQVGASVLELDEKACFNYAWNKLYRNEFLKKVGIIFDHTVLMEDFVFNVNVFLHAREIVTIDKAFSHYRKAPRESLVSKYFEGFWVLCKMKVDAELEVLVKTGNVSELYVEKAIAIHLKHIMSACMKECSKICGKSLKEQYKSVNLIIKDEHTRKSLRKAEVKNKKLRMVQGMLLLNNGMISFIMFKILNLLMTHLASIWRRIKKQM